MAVFTRLADSFRHVPRTFALVWRSSRAITIALAIGTLFSALLPVAIAWVGKELIDAVVAQDTHGAWRWVIVELSLFGTLQVTGRAQGLVTSLLAARLSVDVNTRILEKAITLELRHFEDGDFYDQLTRARREASGRPLSVVLSTFRLVQDSIGLTGYSALLVGFSPLAAGLLLVAALPAMGAEVRFSGQAFRLRNWRSPERRQLAYLEYVLATDEHAKEVQLFGLGDHLLDRYKSTGKRLYLEDAALARRRAAWAGGLSLISTGAFYAVYAWLVLETARGHLSLGRMTLYAAAFRQGQGAFQGLLGSLGSMYEDNLYMTNLWSYLAIPTTAPAMLDAPRERDEQGIRFEDVGFRYPGKDAWALRHVSLFLPGGTSLALVGENGAGKTTFIKLLSRLYEPTEGRILLDGRDLRAIPLDELRRRIGVVFQDFNQYHFSAKDNVGLGSVTHLEELPRVERAIDQGGARPAVDALPQGLQTQLGKWFREGTELSGGQWQAIALSRGFMREEADVLVLDEPTAALDAEAEHRVFERFRKLTQGRTTILISHRFPTVRMADRILVLSHGEIVEGGSHDELVAKGGRYAELFRLQARGYA